MELNKRPSYNIKNNNNNLAYLTQIGVNKRPSYNTNVNVSKFLNNINNNIPIVGGYTKIKKLNSNKTNIMSINNNIDLRNQINVNNLNTFLKA